MDEAYLSCFCIISQIPVGSEDFSAGLRTGNPDKRILDRGISGQTKIRKKP